MALGPGAADGTLERAAAANQRDWLARQAAAAGGKAVRERGVTWTVAPDAAAILFPALSGAAADRVIDGAVRAARRSGAREVSCWSALPTRPADLGERLAVRGFGLGWQAHWMARELDRLPPAPRPGGVVVDVVDPAEPWVAESLPYDDPGAAERRRALAARRPRHVWHVAARRDGTPVGHATLSAGTGTLGVAGIYDVGVRPDERRRGIGRALTAAVCALARERGYVYATLNATYEGELLYRALGFRSVGLAQTWWLHLPRGAP
jgi:ribosomal protein S18 acetylase RimI-like enzyme